jgi:inosine-uridine nucleoside N-ribohydrolase
MIDVIWDMETGDPDDLFTLLILLYHPEVNLKAVTVTPGSSDQIGMVRMILDEFAPTIPIGSFNINHEKKCVSSWYYKVLGRFNPAFPDGEGCDIIYHNSDYNTTIITGGPLKNLGATIKKYPDFNIKRLVAQGGFAGEGVVPDELQLEKFKGMKTCPTYNLNGDPKSGLAVLAFSGIETKRFVSKNVCHGVYYDKVLHEEIRKINDAPKPMRMMWKCMDKYLKKHSNGKKFHDPLAACAAIDESIIEWREVDIYREKGKWGSKICPGSNTWISIGYNKDKFIDTLLKY